MKFSLLTGVSAAALFMVGAASAAEMSQSQSFLQAQAEGQAQVVAAGGGGEAVGAQAQLQGQVQEGSQEQSIEFDTPLATVVNTVTVPALQPDIIRSYNTDMANTSRLRASNARARVTNASGNANGGDGFGGIAEVNITTDGNNSKKARAKTVAWTEGGDGPGGKGGTSMAAIGTGGIALNITQTAGMVTLAQNTGINANQLQSININALVK